MQPMFPSQSRRMTPGLKILVGLFSGLLGLGYLYRPDLIERINAVLRKYLLNDA